MAIASIAAEASLTPPQKPEFVEIPDKIDGTPQRFGSINTTTDISYRLDKNDALSSTVSFAFLKDTGALELNASVVASSSLDIKFSTLKAGVFAQLIGSRGPLARRFDASDLRPG